MHTLYLDPLVIALTFIGLVGGGIVIFRPIRHPPSLQRWLTHPRHPAQRLPALRHDPLRPPQNPRPTTPRQPRPPLAKRVSNLRRHAAIGRAANARYLTALTAAHDPACAYRQLAVLCRPVQRDGRRHRALHPLRRHDSHLFLAELRGEHHLRSFRAADIAPALGVSAVTNPAQRPRQTTCWNRALQWLRAHGRIAETAHTHRRRVTAQGAAQMTAILHLRTQSPACTPQPNTA